jgi:hypothetical protein
MLIFIKLKKSINNKIFIFLSASWALVQSILLFKFGVVTNLEAEKYIGEAQSLIQSHQFTEPKYIFYSATILVIYCSLKLTGGYLLAVVIQIILNGLSTYWFFKLTQQVTSGSYKVSFLSTLLFITFFPLQQWTTHLYTESLFFSLTIGLSYLLAKTYFLSIKSVLAIVLALCCCILSRPFGLLFVLPVFLFLFILANRNQKLVMALLLFFGITGMFYLINYAFNGGGDMNAMRPFTEEHIICFMPTNASPQKLNLLNSGNGVKDIFYYIIHNPGHFTSLGCRRLISFFNLYRSYFSTSHNTYLIGIMSILYGGVLIGFRAFTRNCPTRLKWYLLSLIIIYPLATILQCDDYHSRFAMVIFPYIIIIASMGLNKILPGMKQ